MQPWAMVWKSQSPRLRQNLPKSLPHALEKGKSKPGKALADEPKEKGKPWVESQANRC